MSQNTETEQMHRGIFLLQHNLVFNQKQRNIYIRTNHEGGMKGRGRKGEMHPIKTYS